jgi:hypothetical protein
MFFCNVFFTYVTLPEQMLWKRWSPLNVHKLKGVVKFLFVPINIEMLL